MRRRDDDLSPFRDDPVFQALTGPGTPDELAGEAEAIAAFRASTQTQPRRRTAARVAASGTAAVVVLGLSGGVAAAYTAHLPESAQQTLHDAFGSIGIPAPHPHHHKSGAAATPITSPAPAPVPVQSSAQPQPHATSSAGAGESESPAPTETSTLPVALPTPTVTPTATASTSASPTPTPTQTRTGPFRGATLAITATDAKVMFGGSVTVTGRLVAADSSPIADRKVWLRYRATGTPGWSHLGPQLTATDGTAAFTVPDVQHSLKIVLHAGHHVRSAVTRVAVVPVITVRVSPIAAGSTSTVISISVAGAQPGDVVVIRADGGRQSGRQGGQRVTLDGSLSATAAVPVSQTQAIHYRAFMPRTRAHAAHVLRFYVPASGTTS